MGVHHEKIMFPGSMSREIHGSGPDHAGLPKDPLPIGQAAMQMDSLFRAEPYLKHRYRSFFAVAVPPTPRAGLP